MFSTLDERKREREHLFHYEKELEIMLVYEFDKNFISIM